MGTDGDGSERMAWNRSAKRLVRARRHGRVQPGRDHVVQGLAVDLGTPAAVAFPFFRAKLKKEKKKKRKKTL